MKKRMPRISFITGTIGLESAKLSYILNTSTSSSSAKNLALNSVSLLSRFLRPRHLSNHPPSALACSQSFFFNSSPSFSISATAAFKVFLVFVIQPDFLALGLLRNSLIISSGNPKRPTPPQITTHIHPKNDMMAMTYTAKDAQSSRVTSVSDCEMVQLFISAAGIVGEPFDVIACTGSSTNLKKFQVMKSSKMEMMLASTVQMIPLTMRLQKGSYSSVSQKNKAKGRSKHMKMRTVRQTKYQKPFMSIPLLSSADTLATSSGTINACAWQRVNPSTTSTLQQRAVPKPLSSECTQNASRQILMASSMITKMMASAINSPLFIIHYYLQFKFSARAEL